MGSTSAGSRRSSRWLSRVEWIAWIALVLVLVWVRWPLVKGWFYRVAPVEARATDIPWRTDFEAALAEARQTGRPVLVDFWATWCAPCLAMKHDVWTDPEVARAVTSAYVPVAIDIDRNPALSDRYEIVSVPTLLVVDANGRVVRRAGYLPASGVIRFAAGR